MLGARCTRWTVLRESVPNVGHLKYSKVVLTEYLTIPQMDKCLYTFNQPISWGVTKLIWWSIHCCEVFLLPAFRE
jgi:hypothetical protein